MSLILVAEDTPEVASLIKDLLETRGHQVAMAADGVAMIEKAKTLRPKLIVSDIMMPGAYGSSAYKALQDDPYTKDIPVLFLTGVAQAQAEKVVPKAPGVRLLFKPLNLAGFMAAVAELLPVS